MIPKWAWLCFQASLVLIGASLLHAFFYEEIVAMPLTLRMAIFASETAWFGAGFCMCKTL